MCVDVFASSVFDLGVIKMIVYVFQGFVVVIP